MPRAGLFGSGLDVNWSNRRSMLGVSSAGLSQIT
jgi:hypothetical protein